MGALSEDEHQRIGVRAESDVGAARRAGEAELTVTELATNLARHAASGGYLFCRRAGGGIELLAVIADQPTLGRQRI